MSEPGGRVRWFELPVRDMGRAKAFYERVLGLEIDVRELGPLTMGWFPWERDGWGSAGALVQQESYVPSRQGALVYFGVEEVSAALKRVEEAGGKVLHPKKSIGEHGFVGHFEDCEGNRVGLLSPP